MPLLADAVDIALEATVVPAYTRPGFALRSRLDDWEDLSGLRLDGRTAVVTGATAGIGHAVATRLASMGATIRSASRSQQRAEQATEQLRAATGNDDVHVTRADLSRPAEAERWASEVAEAGPVDVLVHVAGAFFGQHTTTPDGIEANAALYVLGPFVVTSVLADRLRASPDGRVVTVSTGGMYAQQLDVDRVEADADGYQPLQAYAQVKRAQMALTHEWARRLEGDAVAHAMQPGWCDTGLVAEGLPRFRSVLGPILRSPEEGADTAVWLAAAAEPARCTGRLWRDRRPRLEHRVPWTRAGRPEQRRLWDWCAARSGHQPRL